MSEHGKNDDLPSIEQLLQVKCLEQNLNLLRMLHDERLGEEFLLESGGNCNFDIFKEWCRKKLSLEEGLKTPIKQ